MPLKPRWAAGGVPALASLLVLLSSACCVGPLAVALSFVGLTGATLLAIENVVGPFRPLILALTLAALAAGFYLAYRPAGERCDDGAACERPAARRLERTLLWIAAGLFAVLLYFTYVHPNLDVLFGVY